MGEEIIERYSKLLREVVSRISFALGYRADI
jgi:hypothetical protein